MTFLSPGNSLKDRNIMPAYNDRDMLSDVSMIKSRQDDETAELTGTQQDCLLRYEENKDST